MKFVMPSVGKWIAIALSLIIGVGALYLRSRIPLPEKTEEGYKAAKKKRNPLMIAGVLALCALPLPLCKLFKSKSLSSGFGESRYAPERP